MSFVALRQAHGVWDHAGDPHHERHHRHLSGNYASMLVPLIDGAAGTKLI